MLSALSRRFFLSLSQRRSIQSWPESSLDIEAFIPPDIEDRKLPPVESAPSCWPENVPAGGLKHPKAHYQSRGPEKIHNQLMYKQYGIIALGGGAFAPGHFDIIRSTVNRLIDTNRMFAIWRVDPPWKPVGKKPLGKRMGGGKLKIHHYVTPVKAGRVIIEIAGRCEFEEVKYMLDTVCNFLPVDAMPISQSIMDDLKKEKLELDSKNINPFSFEYVIRKNMTNCHQWLSDYDLKWYGKYP